MKRKLFSKIRIATSAHLIVALFAFLVGGETVNAAALTALSDTMSTLRVSALSNHDIQFTTPTGVAASATIILTFQSNFSIGIFDFNDADLLDDGTNVTLAATPSGTTWGVATTSSTITFTNGSAAVGAGSVIRIRLGTNAVSGATGTHQITNTTSTGNKTIAMTGTFGDTGTTTVAIITDDRVTLTATVDQSITFSVSATSAAFGTLSTLVARFASSTAAGDGSEVEAHNLIVGTNAGSGYSMTVNSTGANQGTLSNGAFSIATSSTNVASSPGTEQFGLRMNVSGTGSGTVSAPYAAAGFAFDSATFPDQIASAVAATANNTFSVRYIANIASNTEAGSYSTTLTYVATANF